MPNPVAITANRMRNVEQHVFYIGSIKLAPRIIHIWYDGALRSDAQPWDDPTKGDPQPRSGEVAAAIYDSSRDEIHIFYVSREQSSFKHSFQR